MVAGVTDRATVILARIRESAATGRELALACDTVIDRIYPYLSKLIRDSVINVTDKRHEVYATHLVTVYGLAGRDPPYGKRPKSHKAKMVKERKPQSKGSGIIAPPTYGHRLCRERLAGKP